jgi:CCR4-NOT transcription complex subunit 1
MNHIAFYNDICCLVILYILMKSIDVLHFFVLETATEFAISLIQTLVTQESSSVSELFNVVDALSKVIHLSLEVLCSRSCYLVGLPINGLSMLCLQLAIRPRSPDSLQHLIEIARSGFSSSASYAASKVIQSRDKKVCTIRNGCLFLCTKILL